MRLNNFPAKTLAKKNKKYKLPNFFPGVVVVASKSTYICQLIIFIYKYKKYLNIFEYLKCKLKKFNN